MSLVARLFHRLSNEMWHTVHCEEESCILIMEASFSFQSFSEHVYHWKLKNQAKKINDKYVIKILRLKFVLDLILRSKLGGLL